MRTRPLLVTALVVLSVALAHARPPVLPLPARAPAPPPADTFDQLVDRLAELRAQELDLLARRAALERQVRERLAEQSRRLEQVGVSAAAVAAPTVPPPGVSVDLPPLPLPKSQAPANVGFPPDPAPPLGTRPTYSPWSGEIETIAHREREPGWTQPGELADRFDALGGLPVAYTRWRNTGVRWGPEPVPSFGFSIHTGY